MDEAHAASDEHDHARLLHREASSSATTSVLIYDAHDSTEPGVARLRRMSSSGAPFAPGHDFGQRHDADHDFAEQHRAAMPGQHADDALDARKTLLSPPGAPPILANGKHRDSDASLPTTAVDGTTLARLRTPTNASGAASSTLADDSDRHRQRVHLEEEVYADFSAYIIERRKLFLYYIGVMLTAGILYLAARWSIRFRLWLTARKTTLARATHILAENNWKERAVVQVESVQLPMDAAESVFAALVVDECDFAIDDGNHMSGEVCREVHSFYVR